MPNVVVIAGPNGAGKSTLAPALLRDTFGITEYVNADTIAEGLSAFAPEQASISAGRVMLQRLHQLAAERKDFAFETTLASRHYAEWLQTLQLEGYYVSLVFLWLRDIELAVERVQERIRVGGHSIPDEVIRRRFERGFTNLFNRYIPIVDEWILFDASLKERAEIARFTKESGLEVGDDELWKVIRN